MKQATPDRSGSLRLLLAVVSAIAVAANATAVDNLYSPATGGLWSSSGNWSLGHCPLASESPHILVSGNANKIVSYNWTGATGFPEVMVDGNATGYYGMLLQTGNALTTTDMMLGDDGPAYQWMEGSAYLRVDDIFYIGYYGPGEGTLYLACTGTGSGVSVGDLLYVGYHGEGLVDHLSGLADVYRLYIGQNAPGEYELRGSNATVEIQNQFVLGNADQGTVTHSAGSIDQTAGTNGLIMGLNTGGTGNYNMTGGTFDTHHLSMAWNGDAFFNQTGGTVTTGTYVTIGYDGTHPLRAVYRFGGSGSPALNIGEDLRVGQFSPGAFEFLGPGTATVTDAIEIWKGTTTASTSYLYMDLDAGTLSAASVTNHTGYYDQDGGILTTQNFTNDSTQGVNLDNNADCRARHLDHNAGTLWMYRNAILRGPATGLPGIFWLCEFTNNATFQMGSTLFDGGRFSGTLTNNGTFNYYQGDFTGSTLINAGAFNAYNPFTCYRFVQNAYAYTVTTSAPITADGAAQVNAFENNQNLKIANGAHVTILSDKPLVNNGAMYAGSPTANSTYIDGNVENNGYLLPAYVVSGTGQLRVMGDFKQNPGAELRMRLYGTAYASQYDALRVDGFAALGGELDVRLYSGFTPVIGTTFYILTHNGSTGTFSPLYLPTLPAGRAWDIEYRANDVRLIVVGDYTLGDMNCDGIVDVFDINPFVTAVLDPVQYNADYPGCNWLAGDINDDNQVDVFDINPFVDLLLN